MRFIFVYRCHIVVSSEQEQVAIRPVAVVDDVEFDPDHIAQWNKREEAFSDEVCYLAESVTKAIADEFFNDYSCVACDDLKASLILVNHDYHSAKDLSSLIEQEYNLEPDWQTECCLTFVLERKTSANTLYLTLLDKVRDKLLLDTVEPIGAFGMSLKDESDDFKDKIVSHFSRDKSLDWVLDMYHF